MRGSLGMWRSIFVGSIGRRGRLISFLSPRIFRCHIILVRSEVSYQSSKRRGSLSSGQLGRSLRFFGIQNLKSDLLIHSHGRCDCMRWFKKNNNEEINKMLMEEADRKGLRIKWVVIQ
jgi:hypothetical protein